MTEMKVCPKCNGNMAQGRIIKFNEHTISTKYLYVFEPDQETDTSLAGIFSGKPMAQNRKPLVAYCCDQCGFVEFYGTLP